MKLDLFSEKVSEYGGMTGSGAKKVLGAPEISPFGVVVREALQNSWDAQDSRGSVTFGIKGYELSTDERKSLASAMREGTGGSSPVFAFPRADEPLDGLVLFDRGTSGLGGPVRPNVPWAGDFARFVYLMGATKSQMTKVSTGGTYGFGRSAFLNASANGTILIHTHCRNEDDVVEARFIGMTWEQYDSGDSQVRTGRHWWGRRGRDKWVGPVIGAEADELATAIGMPVPAAKALGTTIMVVRPKWSSAGDDDSDIEVQAPDIPSALGVIKEGVLLYAWPRISSGELKIDLHWFGKKIAMPDPAVHPRLKPFVQALSLVEGKTSPGLMSKHVDIHCLKPKRRLGGLGLIKGAHVPGSGSGASILAEGSPLHHVALMRDTRLVVEYLPCVVPVEGSQYAGVFVTDEEVDKVFAASEPPTHDKWVKEQLPKGDRTLVSVALREIPREARDFALPVLPATAVAGGELAMVAEQLGSLLPETEGGAVLTWNGGKKKPQPPKTPPRRPGSGKKSPRLPVAEAGAPTRRVRDGRIFLEIPVAVVPGERPANLVASVDVVIDGGNAEKAPPVAAALPEVVGWTVGPTTDSRVTKGNSLRVSWQDTVPVVLTVSQPRDCSLRIRLSVDS